MATIALAALLAGCGNLGVGEADCTPPERGLSAANIMTLQAVPTARYTPCLNELRLGWDSVTWFARNDEAGIRITGGSAAFDTLVPFLTAKVTAACDVTEAREVQSGYSDIRKYEEVEFQQATVNITIVPSGEPALVAALRLSTDLQETRLQDRPVRLKVDLAIDEPARTRLDRALADNEIVWLVNELDADEGTVEMRSNDPAIVGSGITPGTALDTIEENLPDVFYRGNWYFTFDGGCITYEFDAKGSLAESVVADAEDALGFYPAFRLRALAEDAGYDVVGD